MKLKAFLKALLLVTIVCAAIAAFFSYDVIQGIRIMNDASGNTIIRHTFRGNKDLNLVADTGIQSYSDTLHKVKIRIYQDVRTSTKNYEARNMTADLKLPKNVKITKATYNDVNEQFDPVMTISGNELSVICSCKNDYLDIDLIVEGVITSDPGLELSYDIYGRGIRRLARFPAQRQTLEISLGENE